MKKYKPTTSSLRHTVLLNKKGQTGLLSKKISPLKVCLSKYVSKAGRNHQGIITVRARKKGHSKRLRNIHYLPRAFDGLIETIEYSPKHNANISRIFVEATRERFYAISSKNLIPGTRISNKAFSEYKEGNITSVFQVPLGGLGFCLLVNDFRVASSAGCFIRVLKKSLLYTLIKLPSGEERLVLSNSRVSCGQASNTDKNLVSLGKAGRKRWLGRGVIVRGVAKNPIDHPHGGGEGKTSGGRPSVSPWGKPAHNFPTRRAKNPLIVKSRPKKN